jgi:hypothetical protein
MEWECLWFSRGRDRPATGGHDTVILDATEISSTSAGVLTFPSAAPVYN